MKPKQGNILGLVGHVIQQLVFSTCAIMHVSTHSIANVAAAKIVHET